MSGQAVAIAVCASLQRHSPYGSKVRRCPSKRFTAYHTVSLASSVPTKSEPSEMAFSSKGAEHSRYTNVGLCITGSIFKSLEKNVCRLLSRNRGVRSNNAALDVTLRSCKSTSQLTYVLSVVGPRFTYRVCQEPVRSLYSTSTIFGDSGFIVWRVTHHYWWGGYGLRAPLW